MKRLELKRVEVTTGRVDERTRGAEDGMKGVKLGTMWAVEELEDCACWMKKDSDTSLVKD